MTPVGWYADIPKDAAAFVRPGKEIEDIQAHLRALMASPARYAARGQEGRRILERQHSPEKYVDTLLGFVAKARRYRAAALAELLAERVGAELSAWIGAAAADACRRAGEEIYQVVA